MFCDTTSWWASSTFWDDAKYDQVWKYILARPRLIETSAITQTFCYVYCRLNSFHFSIYKLDIFWSRYIWIKHNHADEQMMQRKSWVGRQWRGHFNSFWLDRQLLLTVCLNPNLHQQLQRTIIIEMDLNFWENTCQ